MNQDSKTLPKAVHVPARWLRPVEGSAASERKPRVAAAPGRMLKWLPAAVKKRTLEAGMMKLAAVKSLLPTGGYCSRARRFRYSVCRA